MSDETKVKIEPGNVQQLCVGLSGLYMDGLEKGLGIPGLSKLLSPHVGRAVSGGIEDLIPNGVGEFVASVPPEMGKWLVEKLAGGKK
jgi:hypothetical protein